MALTSIDLVLSLDEVGSADAPRVGRKAATLGELKRAGFPVPEGVVVTTEALVRALAAAGLDAGAGPDQVEAVPLPGEVAAAVATAAARLGGGPLAVRSSGVDEDLPGASYAGQYESVLGVPAGDLAAASSHAQQADTRVLSGIAASPGRHTGPVRVVMDEFDFRKLRPGDVLVCPVTSPVWSVLFPSVGALVTDTGGLLSHPAIIAREYGVPAVVATGNATALLRDDQVVTVDGTTGRIEVQR
jgi:phosphoenolpyruvate synthase/pyruvate phosphate dikinase